MISQQYKIGNIANLVLAMPLNLKKKKSLRPWKVVPFTNWRLIPHLWIKLQIDLYRNTKLALMSVLPTLWKSRLQNCLYVDLRYSKDALVIHRFPRMHMVKIRFLLENYTKII